MRFKKTDEKQLEKIIIKFFDNRTGADGWPIWMKTDYFKLGDIELSHPNGKSFKYDVSEAGRNSHIIVRPKDFKEMSGDGIIDSNFKHSSSFSQFNNSTFLFAALASKYKANGHQKIELDDGLVVTNKSSASNAVSEFGSRYSQNADGKFTFASICGPEQIFRLELGMLSDDKYVLNLDLDKNSKYSNTIVDTLKALELVASESEDKMSGDYKLILKNNPEAVLKAIYWAPEVQRKGLKKMNWKYSDKLKTQELTELQQFHMNNPAAVIDVFYGNTL